MAQLHQLKPNTASAGRKRVGRGGKRGTYSGRGTKGQKARAGAHIGLGFRGGDTPVWKLFSKQRGASKRVAVKHSRFQVAKRQATIVNLSLLNSAFKDGDTVSVKSLLQKNLIDSAKDGVKVLAMGEVAKKLKFSGLKLSKAALDKIQKAGGEVVGAGVAK